MITSAGVADSDSNIYTHLTVIVAVKVWKKRVTDSNSDVTVNDCGGGTNVWTKQASNTDCV